MKKDIGPATAMYPSLTTIVGTVVDGRPNFLAVAHVGIMNHGQPQYISVGINKGHYSPRGIHEHGQFSVNIPSEDLMVETDYVGIVTGKNTDKSQVFKLYAGELPHAPLIKQCPVAMECRLHQVVDFEKHEVFIGEIVKTWADESVLTDKGHVDPAKVRPLLFDMGTVSYYGIGPALGGCWNVGKKLKKG
ncbi:flavin reductase family protein [Fundidesulfovibrio terrae]|uniref:flavin reductase family protein n=1 Tax=Fundidesulfovibrio terrae TaxID=2922866 RepID=UPI001FAFE5C1|nr:flavin reductase family protein [Fundidesulfovibrio terrae]